MQHFADFCSVRSLFTATTGHEVFYSPILGMMHRYMPSIFSAISAESCASMCQCVVTKLFLSQVKVGRSAHTRPKMNSKFTPKRWWQRATFSGFRQRLIVRRSTCCIHHHPSSKCKVVISPSPKRRIRGLLMFNWFCIRDLSGLWFSWWVSSFLVFTRMLRDMIQFAHIFSDGWRKHQQSSSHFSRSPCHQVDELEQAKYVPPTAPWMHVAGSTQKPPTNSNNVDPILSW